MENLNYKLGKNGFIFNGFKKVEKLSYSDYLIEYGGDETTTPRGVAPRLFLDERDVMTWGVNGNNLANYRHFDTKKNAKMFLFQCFEGYIEEKNWDAPRFFETKKELYQDLSEIHCKKRKVIKRYFKIEKANLEKIKLLKMKYDSRPIFTIEMMKKFINENIEMIEISLKELNELKTQGNKEIWQVKANSLIQKVSNNDFRILKWKDVYKLIRNEF